MLGPRCKHQQQLGIGTHSGVRRVQQHTPHFLTQRGSAADPALCNRVIRVACALEHGARQLQVRAVVCERHIHGRDQPAAPVAIQVRFELRVGVREATCGYLDEPAAPDFGVARLAETPRRIQFGQFGCLQAAGQAVDEVNPRLRTPVGGRNVVQPGLARGPRQRQRPGVVEIGRHRYRRVIGQARPVGPALNLLTCQGCAFPAQQARVEEIEQFPGDVRIAFRPVRPRGCSNVSAGPINSQAT